MAQRVRLFARSDQGELSLVVENDGGGVRVTVDDETLDARRVGPSTWSVIRAGRSFVLDVTQGKDGRWQVDVDGATCVVTVMDALEQRLEQALGSKKESRSGEPLRAPMPGKVVKILVKAGDAVKAGQSLVVVEAMKMENEVVALHGGVVAQVHVTPGQAVEAQELLVTLS